MRRRPLPSTGSLRLVPQLPGYYETLRLPDRLLAALRCLRLAIPRSDCISSPFGPSRTADGSSRSLLDRLLLSRLSSRNCQDLPSSRGTLVTMRPVLRPRRDRIRGRGPIVNGSNMAPASKQNGGSPHCEFRGSIARHLVWLSTPRSEGLPLPHARLASGCWSQLYRTGFRTRRVPVKGFRMLRFFLPSRVTCASFVSCVSLCSLPRGWVRSAHFVPEGRRAWVRSSQFALAGPRAWVRSSHFRTRRTRFLMSPAPLSRLTRAPRTPRDGRPVMSIETPGAMQQRIPRFHEMIGPA